MYEGSIAIIFYPSLVSFRSIIILDPMDRKVFYFDVSSEDEVKEEVKRILKDNLPFCAQGHDPLIHMGHAYIMSWSQIPEDDNMEKYAISTPEDVDKVIDKLID